MNRFDGFTTVERPHEKRFSHDRLTIETVSSRPEMKGKMREIDWPIELQGKGTTDEKEKTMRVKFPKGDVILSFVTTIHELGHLGQEQLDASLKAEEQSHLSLMRQEQDAWQRGWERMMRARPDVREFLQRKLELLAQSSAVDFKTIDDFYNWVQDNILKMVEAQKVLFEPDDVATSSNEDRFDRLAEELQKTGIDDFLKKYNTIRLGELVDEEQMISFIKDIVKTSAAELNRP